MNIVLLFEVVDYLTSVDFSVGDDFVEQILFLDAIAFFHVGNTCRRIPSLFCTIFEWSL